ncbi:DUF5610 domain-containing protein [Planctobacterium marinum]|uniref:DUF5610 domain-containing protein n=1 Tax=Planctobacterium marinum TaxID=1631968 RepID=A0AA48KQM7_9ALTE|nr:hypothetical protein MACH26_34570 [Planctobacterium marinum]
MNLGDIKSTGAEKAQVEGKKVTPDKLATAGDNQALKAMVDEQVSLSSNAKSVAAARILQSSFDQNVMFSGQAELLADLKPKPKNQPFDFEEVAENVLTFIGGALKLAKQNGADDEKLTEMFEQARKGVEKGISLARKDLAAFMNEELDEGITNSLKAITKGLDELKEEYFGKPESEAVGASLGVAGTQEESSELKLRTAEGDEVTISFESIQRFRAQQEVYASQQTSEGGTVEVAAGYRESYEFFQSERFSFSVKGDLSAQELEDIAKFVEQTSGVVDEFFNGDIEKAYQQASDIGLEDSQITAFALELSKSEQLETVQRYEQVSNYNESEAEKTERPPIKTISEYLDNLLDSIGKNDQIFGQRNTFDELVNGLISEVENIKTPELLEAFNRFQEFNQRLLSSLPEAQSSVPEPEPNNVT